MGRSEALRSAGLLGRWGEALRSGLLGRSASLPRVANGEALRSAEILGQRGEALRFHEWQTVKRFGGLGDGKGRSASLGKMSGAGPRPVKVKRAGWGDRRNEALRSGLLGRSASLPRVANGEALRLVGVGGCSPAATGSFLVSRRRLGSLRPKEALRCGMGRDAGTLGRNEALRSAGLLGRWGEALPAGLGWR